MIKNFHFSLYYFGILNEKVVFDGLVSDSVGTTVGCCFLAVFFVLAMEMIKWIRITYFYDADLSTASVGKMLSDKSHIISSILYGLQMLISYTIMLFAMLYNVYLIVSICVGFIIGHWIFGVPPRKLSAEEKHMHDFKKIFRIS